MNEIINKLLSFYVFNFSLIAILGIITLILLLITATLGFLIRRGKIRMKWHFWLARLTIAFALIHAALALSVYFR